MALATALSLVLGAGSSFAQRGGDETVESTEELNLAVGENKTISAADVNNYSEGTKGVADVKLTTDGKRFVIVGRGPGSTTLLLINKDGSQTKWVINVFARSPDAVEREVKQLLEGTSGVRVRRVGARFFIEGGVTAEADVRRIERIATLYPGQVESLVVVGAAPVESKLNIRIDFYFVQYERNSSYAFGVNWPGRIGGEVIQSELSYDLLSSTVTTAQASVVNQPLPGLDIAARNGWAKVLKQSTVITTNGTEATFESGGEQNYAISEGLTANIRPITYGTNVTVLPRFDADTEELEVKIVADVSDLIPPVTSTNLPGRSVSKLSTLVSMKLGESLVLSGIRSQSQRRSIGGLPLLSEIPILGLFFGSESQTREDVEGAVFIIPSVVESLPRDSLRLVNAAAAQYEEYSGDIEAINAFNKRPPMSGKGGGGKE
jgi:pilus assembly protein CpaC